MDYFQSVLQLVFDMMERTDVEILRCLLVFYLIVSAVLVFISLVKGVKR